MSATPSSANSTRRMSNAHERLCKCDDWAVNARKINDILGRHAIRTGQQYDGKKFSYCPFCGKELLFVLDDTEFERQPPTTEGVGTSLRDGLESEFVHIAEVRKNAK